MNCKNAKKILISDDVESIAQLMQFLLNDKGFKTEIVENTETYLEKISSFKPDLIILDLMMPGIHGINILKKIKSENETKNIGVIICSTENYKTDIENIKKLGADDIIIKPLNNEEFVDKILKYFSFGSQYGENKNEVLDSEKYLPALDLSKLQLKLWGTRGSIPVSNSKYVRHGGNTSCLSIEDGENIMIIDAGSGIRELGLYILKTKIQNIHLFIGHTHWDHIQGYPFFIPAYIPKYNLHIYAASGFGKDIKSIFQGQLDSDYFPVQLEDMKSQMKFYMLEDNPVKIGNILVYWEYMNHPGATIGFKFRINNKSIAYITDNEFLKGFTSSPLNITINDAIILATVKIIEFLKDVDLYIGEAQYTNEEYLSKIGWGHSSLANACLLVKLSNIKKWIITHHDPMHDDKFLQNKINLTKKILSDLNWNIEVLNAFDGLIELV